MKTKFYLAGWGYANNAEDFVKSSRSGGRGFAHVHGESSGDGWMPQQQGSIKKGSSFWANDAYAAGSSQIFKQGYGND